MVEIFPTSGAVFTVGQVALYLKEYLDANPALSDLTVSGEVSNHRHASSGHHYFTLRDSESALRCVMFRPGRGGQFLNDGAQVFAHGRVSMYPARGDLQFYVDSIRPDGLGALQQAFEELKARLAAEGLFDEGRKRPLPQFPAKIAVITSPEAAALQDILNILGRRYPLGEVVLIPTLVQGAEAAGRIAKAFSALARMSDIDVAIVARGGGSLEDLWPFNEEVVARAIFACGVPVISAVGHETDFTIADFVADLRAPTPSAAAELVAPDVRDLRLDLRETAEGMSRSMSRMLRDLRMSLELAADRLSSRAPDMGSERRRVDEMLARARFATERLVESKRAGLKTLQAQVSALGPEQILNRGYAIVRLAGGTVLVDAGEARVGDGLEVMLAKGRLEAETTRVELDRGS